MPNAQCDIDIAVFVSGEVMKSGPFRYRLRLISDLMSALGRNDVDLVLLSQAPPLKNGEWGVRPWFFR